MGGSGTTKQEMLSIPVCVQSHRQATGYDTPEENERGYEEAKRRLSDLILNKQVDIFYLPKGYLRNLSTHRACHAGRADEGGEVPAGRRLDGERVRRAPARRSIGVGGGKDEADERSSASFMCLKNRSKWLPGRDSNPQPSGYKCPRISSGLGLSLHPP